MIIFYPTPDLCTPIVIADMMDSSDQWSVAEVLSHALLNMPDSVNLINKPVVYSCKYNYSAQHNGVPLGAALKMTFNAVVFSPPAGLIAQVSMDYVSSAESIEQMSDALVKFANPQLKIMTAVIVERTATSVISRSFVAYSVILRPDSYGTNATLFIKGASYNDSLIKAKLGFELKKNEPLNTQLSTLATNLGLICAFDSPSVAASAPVSGRLFQPSTLPKILAEICLQNKIIPKMDEKKKMITFFAQNTISPSVAQNSFSFLGFEGALIWGVGVENYANVKFKTPIFDAALFDKITIFNDSQSALFQGFKKSIVTIGKNIPESYDAYILRYVIDRNNSELCCEVTATNNWLLAQIRIDGILESKVFSAVL